MFGPEYAGELGAMLEFDASAADVLARKGNRARLAVAATVLATTAIGARAPPRRTTKQGTTGQAVRRALAPVCAVRPGLHPGPMDRAILGEPSVTEAFAEADRIAAAKAAWSSGTAADRGVRPDLCIRAARRRAVRIDEPMPSVGRL